MMQKKLRAADGSKTTCDFEFDFHGANQALGGIVIEGESPDFGFKITQSNE